MKKIITTIAAAALVLTVGVTGALAAGPGRGRQAAGGGASRYHAQTVCRYVDADGNGVCDYCGAYRAAYTGGGQYFIDADGNGICDHCGRMDGSCGTGRYYTDANGDGVCDHYAAGGGHHGQGRGAHRGCAA